MMNQRFLLLHLFWVTPLGFSMKIYSGPFSWWFRDYGAGVFYEVFWILVFFCFFPSPQNTRRIPIIVFVMTSALECLQLVQNDFLTSIRSTFLGAALIGTTFVPWDFPHYAFGCFLGYILIFK